MIALALSGGGSGGVRCGVLGTSASVEFSTHLSLLTPALEMTTDGQECFSGCVAGANILVKFYIDERET